MEGCQQITSVKREAGVGRGRTKSTHFYVSKTETKNAALDGPRKKERFDSSKQVHMHVRLREAELPLRAALSVPVVENSARMKPREDANARCHHKVDPRVRHNPISTKK